VEADGYAPFFSRTFNSGSNDVGEVSYDVELRRAAEISGQVVDADGHPVAGAQVALKVPGARLLLNGSEPFFSNPGANDFRLTDASGQFRLSANAAARGLVAVSEKGFAVAETNELSTNMTVRLQPWGRIEGVVWDYNKLVTNQDVWGSAFIAMWPESLRVEMRTNSDDHGRFVFQVVPPGKYRVYRMMPMPNGGASGGSGEVVRVEPGATASVKVGGQGRPVVGRFHLTNPYVPIEWQDNRGINIAQSISPKVPEGLKTREEFEAWRSRPEIQKAFDEIRNYPIQIAADGSFRMDEVVPGKYEMRIQAYDPRDPDAFAYSKYIIDTTKPFEVPQSDSREALDLGAVDIELKPDIKKGLTEAPEIEGTDLDGKKFKLSDFRGKYVLVDFWATWCGPCIAELPYLRQVHDKFKDRKDFVMLSVSIDKTIKEPRDFLKKNDVPWMQGYIGDDPGVPSRYGVEGIPSIFLISPDGKIVETELRGGAMVESVGKRLAQAVTFKTN
jgi:thiol-disulfide isomerase/thioredoxin